MHFSNIFFQRKSLSDGSEEGYISMRKDLFSPVVNIYVISNKHMFIILL
jgi:hypothetical protein